MACQEVETAALIAKVEAAKNEVASIAELIAADLRGDSVINECSPAIDGRLDAQEATLVRNLLRLIPEEKFNAACASSGIDTADATARTMAVLSKIEAAKQPHEPTTVSELGAHRPPGTATAAAAMGADVKDLRMAQMQSEIEAHQPRFREPGQIWADAHDDLETDTEPSAQSSAKRKKLGDFGSAISRLVVP